MFSAFANTIKIPELRQRILFTLGLVFICRIVETVPVPGVDPYALQAVVAQAHNTVGGAFLGFIDLFSGGAFANCAVGALGIMPYISASIILQLMTAIIPELGRLAREGESGRQKLSQYTRYLTILICIIQSLMLSKGVLERPDPFGLGGDMMLVQVPGWGFRLSTILTITTGTMLVMWLGEQITERGIGNGISLIITINIISRLPMGLYQAMNMFKKQEGVAPFGVFHLIGMVAMIFLVIAGTIALTQGQRKIPIHTTRRIVGRKVYGGQNTYMPLRVNYSGVMPIIFASVLISFPIVLISKIPFAICKEIAAAFSYGKSLYLAAYALLILFFSYFWVATQFNPLQIADDLKKNGGYIPGIRSGRPTAEYLDKTMTRITLVGAIALTIIAIIPSVLGNHFNIPGLVASFFGGTSLLIVVGVMLDTMRQIESHLLMRHYDGFLRKGRLRGRR